MAAEERKTFYEYLTEKAKDPTDDPAGDFAIDADADSFFPREAKADANGFAVVMKYLYFNRGAWDSVMDAFMEVWQMYYEDVTGDDWIDPGYSSRCGGEYPEDAYTITGRVLDDLKSKTRLE